MFWSRTIDEFDGEYAFLSNFHPVKIRYGLITYPTVEHAYQASKTNDPEIKKMIAKLPKPGQAKRAAKTVPIIYGWRNTRVDVMSRLVRQKFQDPELRQLLLNTEDAYLIEGNTWGDTFWGVCDGKGSNVLGNILMNVRAEINDQNKRK